MNFIRKYLKKLLFFLLCVLISSSSTFALQTDQMQLPEYSKSIGIDNLPWDASKVSFRWWKNKSVGKEIVIGNFSAHTTWGNDRPDEWLSLTGIQFFSYNKNNLLESNRIHFTKGIGFRLSATTHNYSFPNSKSLTDRFIGAAAIYFPVGIEHLFLNKYPNISYSLEANPYGNIIYQYNYHDPDSGNNSTYHRASFSIGAGVRFYIRYYVDSLFRKN